MDIDGLISFLLYIVLPSLILAAPSFWNLRKRPRNRLMLGLAGSFGSCLFGIVLPFWAFVFSVAMIGDTFYHPSSWKGSCIYGWFDCFQRGKLALIPLLGWAFAAFFAVVVWRAKARRGWMYFGLIWGILIQTIYFGHWMVLVAGQEAATRALSAYVAAIGTETHRDEKAKHGEAPAKKTTAPESGGVPSSDGTMHHKTATVRQYPPAPGHYDEIWFVLVIPGYASIWYLFLLRRVAKDYQPDLAAKSWSFVPSLPLWGAAVYLTRRTYDLLPNEPPKCYVVTAAAQGHRLVVRPIGLVKKADGSLIPVNRQLEILWQFEREWKRRRPRLHRFVRSFYDRFGPCLASRIRKPWHADCAYISLKPIEWLARIYLKIVGKRS